MSKLITHIKRLALTLCLATPIVSWAAAVGDVVTWTNADGLTADDVVNANHCSFDFCIPGTEALPDGSVVRITKVEIASVNATRTTTSSTTDKLNDPYHVSFGNVKSAECEFITTETLAGKYIDSYTFTDACNITIGKEYPEYTSGGTYVNMAGYGVTFLYSNGNRWSGGSRMDCTVGGTTSGFIKNGDIYPIYRITAEVVSVHKDVEVSSDTTASAINEMVGTATDVSVTVADGVTITIDDAFATEIKSLSSTGTITLSAETQPDLSGVSFNVQGALLRSWLAPGVVGVNFVKNYGNVVSGELVTSDSWVETTGANGNATTLFTDGLTKVTWSSGGTYSYSGSDNEGSSFIHGYLDDGNNKGNGVEIYIDNVPYETYDVVIYASTDTSNARFQPKTVNGTSYTVDSLGVVSAGNAVWGQSRLETPVYGQNAMRIKNLSGSLAIYGGLNTFSTNKGRGGIAAIQIMPPTAEDNITEYTLELNGVATDWSKGAWKIGTDAAAAPLTGYAKITLSASTTLTIDDTVALTRLIVNGAEDAVLTLVTGSGTLVVNGSVVVEGGILQQGSESVLGATPSVVVNDGATFDMNGLGINASTKVYLAGAGAGNWPWALTSSSGAGGAILGGLYLTGNATIGGANELKIGQTQAGYYCYLQGFTLTKTGDGALTGTNMNTPGTGTIDVKGGAMSVNQWNNLNNASGDTTVILNSGTSLANGTDRIVPMAALELLGGTLSTASRAFKVKTAFSGAGETANLAFGDGASASLTGDLTVTATMTLDGSMTFLKDAEAASDVVVAPATLAASTGTITVGAGVTFNVGTSRPAATITVVEGGTLGVKLLSASDVITLSTSAEPASIVLYDANGVEVSDPRVSYSDGTLTIMPPVPTLEANGATVFDTAANWVDSTMPEENGDAVIELGGDAEITVSGTYTLGSLTITGSGVVTFSGNGTITADNISVKNGATFTRNTNISATTGISIDAGTVLRLDNVTENAAISGAGAVETYGTVVLAHANTMTGGITVKSGSALSTTAAGGYGEYQAGWAYTAQRQVVVEDGGTVDINNVANNDGAVALTIAGKGILSGDVYSGAVTYSGVNAITSGSRQISSLVLTDDALVDVGAGWGLVHSAWSNARLGLNGHTLTVRGTGTFPVVNANNLSGAATTGTLVMDGATLELSNSASNLAGVNIVAKGCATINVATAPSALGSLTLKPSAAGTTATKWNLPSGLVPVVDSSNIDYSGLSNGDVLTLFTAPQATELTSDTITAKISGRYTSEISGNTVTATYKGALEKFMHYDFNAANSIASDSTYNFGNLNPAFVNTVNGKAGTFNSTAKPYYGSNTSGMSPFHTGEMTVTSLLNIKETNNTILWNFGSAYGAGMALIAKDSTTISVVAWTGGGTGSDVVSVSEIDGLVGNWHLVTIVASAEGTTLKVDDRSESVATVLPSDIGGQGQFGSIHGSAKSYNAVSGDGYLLDDWRVYDVALTTDEIAAISDELCASTVSITVPAVDNTSVSVISSKGTALDNGDGTYTVVDGATITVTYTSDAYEVTGGTFEFTASEGYSVDATGVKTTQYVASITASEATTKYTSLQAAVDAAANGNNIVLLASEVAGATVSREVTFNVVPGEYTYGDIVADGDYILTTTALEGKTRYTFAQAVIAVTINEVRTLYTMYNADTGIEAANAGPIGTTIEILSGDPATYVAYLPMFDLANGVFTKVADPVAAVYNGVIQQQVYRSLAGAIEAATAGQTVKLLANDTVSLTDGSKLVINKALTIDGNGNTVYGKSEWTAEPTDVEGIVVDGTGDVTITNVTLSAFGDKYYCNNKPRAISTASTYTGKLTLDTVTIEKFCRQAVRIEGGTFEIKDSTITGNAEGKGGTKSDFFQQGIEVRGSASGSITGTTITGIAAYFGKASVDNGWDGYFACGIVSWTTGTVTVEDCTITAATLTDAWDNDGGSTGGAVGIDNTGNGTLTVSGSTTVTVDNFAAVVLEDNDSGTLAITGGTYNGVVRADRTTGTLTSTDNTLSILEGFEWAGPVEGVYTLQAVTPSDTYEITGETELGEGGTLNIGSATTIKIGSYDVTAGFRIDGTTATLLAPEVEEEATKKAIDVGADTVTLNVDLVPGLYYGVASGAEPTLSRPKTLTQYTDDDSFLTVTKPSAEKGFFKVFVDIKE